MSSNSPSKILGAPCLLMLSALLMLAGCGSSNYAPTTSTGPVSNTATVIAGFGPEGPAGGFVNGIRITLTVCQHGTRTCAPPIDNVLVDTGSVGLRLVPSALGSLTLNQILASGSPLLECIQYGDSSYSWGPMALADVQIAGEQALNIPIQLLGATSAPVPANCLTMPVNPSLPNGGNVDTLATLGANGILGIGGFIVDCGTFCNTASSTPGYPYYICPGNSCTAVGVPTADQATNAVAAFSSTDHNGVMITFPLIPAMGATTLSGTINFGIGTQTDNALGNVTLYAVNQCGDIPTVIFNNVTYTDTACSTGSGGSGAFVDTGSNALVVSDAGTLASFGISDCAQNTNGFGFYCVTGGGSTTLPNIRLFGDGNVGSNSISLNIEDATTLVNTNNGVFNDLGTDSGSSPSTDFFDLGAPFFFGRTVFIGIAGESGNNFPNGFVAF